MGDEADCFYCIFIYFFGSFVVDNFARILIFIFIWFYYVLHLL